MFISAKRRNNCDETESQSRTVCEYIALCAIENVGEQKASQISEGGTNEVEDGEEDVSKIKVSAKDASEVETGVSR